MCALMSAYRLNALQTGSNSQLVVKETALVVTLDLLINLGKSPCPYFTGVHFTETINLYSTKGSSRSFSNTKAISVHCTQGESVFTVHKDKRHTRCIQTIVLLVHKGSRCIYSVHKDHQRVVYS